MSRLTRDGTAEPVSRDLILRRERGQGNIHFPVQLTTCRVGNLARLIHALAICVTMHLSAFPRCTIVGCLTLLITSALQYFSGPNMQHRYKVYK